MKIETREVPGSDQVRERRVLIAAPTGCDAEVLCEILGTVGTETRVCPDAHDLSREIERGAGVAVIAEETLTSSSRRLLADTLSRQPEWSDFPLIVMTAGETALGPRWQSLNGDKGYAHAVVLERPVRRLTLVSTVRTALKSRVRQYQVRDELLQRQRVEAALRKSSRLLEHTVAERTTELERQNRRLRRLANQLSDAEQRERAKLAKNLHDGLQQILIAGKMQLPLCSGPQAAETLQRLGTLLDEAIAASRSLSYELSPPALHSSELPEVVGWLARWFQTNHHFEVRLRIDDDFPDLPEQIKSFLFHAIRELLLNSVKHSGRHVATVELQRQAAGQIRMSVSDEGRGFHPAEIEQEVDDSHGFGLFSIRERIIALGGTFEIDTAPGAGTRFVLSVPVREGRRASRSVQTAPQSAAPERRRRLDLNDPVRVLIVDDHGIVREGLVSLLQRQELVELVGEAADGFQAVEQTRKLQPDVVLMDVNMPRMNGIEATRQIKRILPQTAIIGLSFHEEQDMARAMCEAGASAYLQKGGDAETLFETICDVCRKISS